MANLDNIKKLHGEFLASIGSKEQGGLAGTSEANGRRMQICTEIQQECAALRREMPKMTTFLTRISDLAGNLEAEVTSRRGQTANYQPLLNRMQDQLENIDSALGQDRAAAA